LCWLWSHRYSQVVGYGFLYYLGVDGSGFMSAAYEKAFGSDLVD